MIFGSVPFRSDTILLTSFDYDSAGRQWKVTDPKAIESRTFFDALGRTTKTIENYVDGTVGDDNDKTTEYTYNAAGMTTLKALLTGGGYQTTEWIYGVSGAIVSNDIVIATRWPDPSSGSASSGQQDTVTVNALGQTLTSTDRNGTVHTLAYDVLGRLTTDTVTTLGTNIDGAVRRVETAYDGQGNAYLLTNYDATSSGNIVNQVQRAFNGLGQMTTEWQSHAGAVNTSTSPKVQYAYSEMASGANHSRLTSMTHSNGRVITSNYTSGLDSDISRLSELKDGSTVLGGYSYVGLGTVVKRSHSQPGVDLSYVKLSGESVGDAGDQYTGLDRFGRIVDQRWLTAANGVAVDRFHYTYDRNGNRLTESNLLNTSLNETYGYDSLNQLTNFATSGTTKSWDFDALGNWDGVTTNSTTQTRTHNRQNEITAVSGATTPVFDANGNMTTDETGKQYVYDAWNRLVVVKDSSGTEQVRYEYDGLTRRIQEHRDSTGQVSDLYYSDKWQVIQENTHKDVITYVWSPVYVDAMVARDSDGSLLPVGRLYATHDANFNVTAITDSSGAVVERYTYDPFGTATVRNASWTVTTPAYGWQYLHQGGRLNAESGLYSFRYREYSPTLGRWVTMDPIGYESQEINLYGNVGNNAVNNLDNTGLYDTDVHFYMTYYIAMSMGLSECNGCDDKFKKKRNSIAYQIAWANEYTDWNSNTTPLPDLGGDRHKRRKFHFRYYSNESETSPKSGAIQEVALDGIGKCNPFLFGIGLHILQDSFSHNGYGPRTGHWTNATDDPSTNIPKAMAMAESTYNFLKKFMVDCCKKEPVIDFSKIRNNIQNLFKEGEGEQGSDYHAFQKDFRKRRWIKLIYKELNIDVEFFYSKTNEPWKKEFEEAADMVDFPK